MEMVSIPLEQYQEFLQMRLELHLIYTKCSEEGPMIPAPMLQT